MTLEVFLDWLRVVYENWPEIAYALESAGPGAVSERTWFVELRDFTSDEMTAVMARAMEAVRSAVDTDGPCWHLWPAFVQRELRQTGAAHSVQCKYCLGTGHMLDRPEYCKCNAGLKARQTSASK